MNEAPPRVNANKGGRRTPERVLEELLVVSARSGERKALDLLARKWRPRHYVHARRYLGAPSDAADAVQDAWLSIVRNIGALSDPARFPAWSYAIVTRRCQDAHRRSFRLPPTEEFIDAPALEPDLETANSLRAAITALSPDHRAMVALYYGEGFTALEISQALNIPVGTVKTRLFHARRRLRRHIEGDTE